MSKELFVIDGTNLVNVLSVDTEPEQRKLTPLLHLLLQLMDNEYSFFCFFDASTRFMFEEDSVDRQMYDIIIGLRIYDFFTQVNSGVSADKLILEHANESGNRVISLDNFTQYVAEYPWLAKDADNRLIQADVIQGNIRIDKLEIKAPIDKTELLDLTFELINRLEEKRGNLEGVIKKFDPSRRFGLIKRNQGGPTLLFHRNQVIDRGLDYTVIGQTVRFKVGIRHSKMKNKFDFCAIDIEELKEVTTDPNIVEQERIKELEVQNEALQELNKNLQDRNKVLNDESNNLQTVNAMQLETIETKDERIAELEAELLKLRTAQKTEAVKLRAVLDKKEEENNELAIALDFQEQKIQSLDSDLKETLHLFEHNKLDPTDVILYEKLKQNYKLLQYSVKQKEARIRLLRTNIIELQDELETTKEVPTTEELKMLRQKIQGLEHTNTELRERITALDTLETTIKSPVKPASKPRKTAKLTQANLENWWLGLESQWQRAFNKAVFSRGETTQIPNQEELVALLKRDNLDIIGERIFFSNFKRLSFSLTNLSGIQELHNLKEINLSGHDLSSFKGLEHLPKLQVINFTSNSISKINGNHAFKSIKSLILRDNRLENLEGILQFKHLEYFDCSNNATLKSIDGVELLKNLKTFHIGYVPKLFKEIKALEQLMPQTAVRDY